MLSNRYSGAIHPKMSILARVWVRSGTWGGTDPNPGVRPNIPIRRGARYPTSGRIATYSTPYAISNQGKVHRTLENRLAELGIAPRN